MKQFRKITLLALASAAAGLGFVPGAAAQQDVITTVMGGGPNGIPAVAADISTPYQVAVDAAGNRYFAAAGSNRIFKINTAGTLTVVAGTGFAGYSGDGGPAVNANLNGPYGVAVDAASPANVFISDRSNCLIRKVNQGTGVITTVVGLINVSASGVSTPSCANGADGTAAKSTALYYPSMIAVNPKNSDLYIADFTFGRIRKVPGASSTADVSTVAGNGSNCGGSAPFGDGGAATGAYLCYPQAITLDTSSSSVNLFITGQNDCSVREVVGSSGKIYTVAGQTRSCGFTDGVAATKGQLNDPWQTTVKVSGATTTVDVADYGNHRIRQFNVTYSGGVPVSGTITTTAGTGAYSYCGDGQAATGACIVPVGLALDGSGNFIIGDYNAYRIREITKSTGVINSIEGWGTATSTNTTYSDPLGISGVPATGLELYQPVGVFADPSSTKVYVAAYNSQNVYVFDSGTGKATNFAGNGVAGFFGDDDPANGATTQLNQPQQVAKDSSGNTYIADTSNCVVREVFASTGDIKTIAGGSVGSRNGCGYSGDGGQADLAKLNGPSGVVIDSSNNLYIGEYYNCVVRKVALSTGTISTVAGTGTCGYNGDGIPATTALLSRPQGVAVDSFGDLFIADSYNHRIREVDGVFHNISTVAGTGVGTYTGDGVATGRSLLYPGGVAADQNGNIFIADTSNQILRWVDPGGAMTTFAGQADQGGFGGDGGPATSGLLYSPEEISRDVAGNTYVADYYNNRIRKVTAFAGYGRSTDELIFTRQGVGTTSEYQPVFLSAIGPTTINSISVSAGFTEFDDCSGVALKTGDTCEVDVYFTPTKTGETTGTMNVSSNKFLSAQATSVALAGSGVGLSVSGSFNFGNLLINKTASQTVTLSNSGAAATLTGISFAPGASYKVTGGTCPAGGGVLGTGASCTITVTFAPTTIGLKKNTLVIGNSVKNGSLLVPVTGTGIAFTLSANSLSFPSIVFGASEALNLTVTNAGTTTLTVSSAVSGPGATSFTVLTTGNTCSAGVAAGKSCTLPVQFKPATVGSLTASLTLTTNGGANPVIALSGTDTTAVKVSATSLAFGSTVTGTTKVLDFTVTNLGSKTLTITTALGGTTPSAFSVLTTSVNTCKSGVAAGKSCVLPVQFAPTSAAGYSASLTLTTNGGTNPVISLSGTGTAAVTVSPGSLAFGTITHGTTLTKSVTITNNGTSTIGVGTSVGGSGSAAYSVLFTSANTCSSGLAAGKSCTLPVEFAPKAAEAYSATLSLFTGSTLTVALTGTGK